MSNRLNLDDEDSFVGTLINLTQQKSFRSAWNLLEANVNPNNIRIYDAGVVLQSLSNEYGDIGEIRDECLLKKKIDIEVTRVIKLLL